MDSQLLRKVQMVQLELLKELDRVCKKHNISYTLSAGTLLGAVRHKGFIPWDDDLDVDMTRENYDRFLQHADELGEQYALQNWFTDSQFALPFSKIRKKNTVFREENSRGLTNSGIYIDIFPWDKTIDSKREPRRFKKLTFLYLMLLSMEPAYQLTTQSSRLKFFLKVITLPYRGKNGRSRLIRKYEKRVRKYSGRTENYRYFVNTAAIRMGKWQLNPEVFENTVLLPFEDGCFPCPADYDGYLTMGYGDYMTPPPVEKRGNRHDIIAVILDTSFENSPQVNMLRMLDAALSGKPGQLSENHDLNRIFALAVQHQCEYACYAGALLCGVSGSQPAMQKLFGEVLKRLTLDEQQLYALESINVAFSKRGIRYLPLKGSILKKLYPESAMRSMGDIDIIVSPEHLPEANELLRALGYRFKLESNHEYVYYKNQLCIELHKSFFPTYRRQYSAQFFDFENLAVLPADGSFCCRMSPENTYIYLLCHLAKHFTDGGIGVRHIMDIEVFRRANPAMDGSLIGQALSEFRLTEFHRNILDTLDAWFGRAGFSDTARQITDMCFESGSFGTAANRLIGTAIANSGETASAKHIQAQNTRALIFPSRKTLSAEYPVLEKHPVLLPALWVVRVFKAVVVKRSLTKQKRRLDTVTAEQITKFRDTLKGIGIE